MNTNSFIVTLKGLMTGARRGGGSMCFIEHLISGELSINGGWNFLTYIVLKGSKEIYAASASQKQPHKYPPVFLKSLHFSYAVFKGMFLLPETRKIKL